MAGPRHAHTQQEYNAELDKFMSPFKMQVRSFLHIRRLSSLRGSRVKRRSWPWQNAAGASGGFKLVFINTRMMSNRQL